MEQDYSYVQVSLHDDMVEDVYTCLLEAGCAPSDKYDLHVTMMYDERDIPEPLAMLDVTREYTAKIIGIGHLGDAYVFFLSSPELREEFRMLKEAGYQHSFEEITLHMSLGYKLSPHDELALNQVFADWMGRELKFNNMSFGFKKDK